MGGSQRVKRQTEGGRKGEETVREAERRKRRVSYPSPALPLSFSF